MSGLIVSLIAALALTPEAAAQGAYDAIDPEYRDCVRGLEEDPEAVRQRAALWLTAGGGAPAEHCHAMGDLAAGYPGLAAIRLQELAERKDAGDALVRARLLDQAAIAFLEAELPETAAEALAAAFAHAPEAGELYLTAARVRFANEDYQAAIDAMEQAEAEGFKSAPAYVASARARMALLDELGAAEDVVEALKIDPLDIDALTLRGDLAQRGIAINASYQRAPE